MTHILVPMETFSVEKFGQIPIYGAFASYVQKLLKYGLLPVFVPPTLTNDTIDELYVSCNGVYLMGGTDIDPKHYGHEKHEKTNNEDALRDAVELVVLRKALKDRKPILAICRGSQALAIASGGTLVQHVPDVVKHERHSQPTGELYHDLATKNKHTVKIEEKSKIHKLLKKDQITVNSGHHQAVATVGEGFQITGTAEDGITETFEHVNENYFCFGVQSHPEVEDNGDLEALFPAFAEASRVYGKNRSS